MRQPIDLVGGFYTDESLPWSVQDTVNYIPVAAEVAGTRTPAKLVDAPGLRPWVAIGNTDGDPTAGAPIRGLHDVEGRLFVVSGRMLYEISQKGVAIPRGAIPGVGRVSMAHNQRGHGHELLVVNGSGGYVYNTGSDTFSAVTDAGYPGAAVVDFLDGYLMQVEPFGRFLFHSDLADALEYNTLDRFEAETQPDRVVGMIVNHQEVWAFGERTIDVFGNAGTAQGTFQNKGVSISRGCIAKWSPAIVDNGVAWLGDDRVVYHARGYDPVRISTRAIEVALSECSLTDIRNAFSFVWSDRGHSVYYLTVPNGQTFGYDFSAGLWHRRASWHPERDIGGRWCLADLVRHNGQWIGGDYRDGRLYALDWDYMLEGCEPLIRERTSQVMHADQRRFTADSIELVVEAGGPETAPVKFQPQPDGPTLIGDAPDGVVGLDYPAYTYESLPGDAPVVASSIIDGALPDGLTYVPAQHRIPLAIPTKAGLYRFTLRDVDASGLSVELSDSILISDRIMAYGVTQSQSAGRTQVIHDAAVWENPVRLAPASQNFSISVPGRVLAWDFNKISYTDDAGVSWQDGATGLGGSGGDRRGDYADGIIVIGGGLNGLYRSMDNGLTVSNSPYPLVNYPVFRGDNPRYLLAASIYDPRFFFSDDSGATFSARENVDLVLNAGGDAFSIGDVFVFGGSRQGRPAISITKDGTDVVKRRIDSADEGFVSSIFCLKDGGRELWLLGTSEGQLFYAESLDSPFVDTGIVFSVRISSIAHNGIYFIVAGGTQHAYSPDGKAFMFGTNPFIGDIKHLMVLL